MNEVRLYFRTTDKEGMENFLSFDNIVRYNAGHGVVQICEHTGVTHMFNIPDFTRVETTPLTEEDILNTVVVIVWWISSAVFIALNCHWCLYLQREIICYRVFRQGLAIALERFDSNICVSPSVW